MNPTIELKRIPTGIEGLDDILNGGFPERRVYLIEGNPGSGKTTLALSFLLEGAAKGERCVYVTLSETADELAQVAHSHGWSLDKLHMLELRESNGQSIASPAEQYTFFHPSEVELEKTITSLLARIEKVNPSRVVFDSLSEVRLLAREPLRFRRQVLAIKQYFIGRGSTVLLLDDKTGGADDLQLQSLAHGVLDLEQLLPQYGAERRRLRVVKLRGSAYRGGFHDFKIVRGGMSVFPRLVANRYPDDFVEPPEYLSGSTPLDILFGGGIARGTSNLILGPAGVGKSSLVSLFANRAMENGEHVAMYIFDEGLRTLLRRSDRIKSPLARYRERNLLTLEHIDPAELSPGEFVFKIRDAVEKRNARVVIIDSLNGYLNAMPEERFLLTQMHELLSYLNQQGVVSYLVLGQHGVLGNGLASPVDVSYLADNALLLRYFEVKGKIRRAISAIKVRDGEPDNSVREYCLTPTGLSVSEPLVDFEGILAGTPAVSVPKR